MYSQSPSEVVSHDVMQTCSYSRWASREILCDRNYIEVNHFTDFYNCVCICGHKSNSKISFKVSHYMSTPDAETKGQKPDDAQMNTVPDVCLFEIKTLFTT